MRLSQTAVVMRSFSLLLALSIWFSLSVEAWIPGSQSFHLPGTCASQGRSMGILPLAASVESISLGTLDDHEQVGLELAGSVQRWLDAEWMVQDCHARIGEACRVTYLQCRQEKQDDLMTIMTEVADSLERDWQTHYDDAFVNAWDISNYVSDYLTKRVGIDGCECSAKIY